MYICSPSYLINLVTHSYRVHTYVRGHEQVRSTGGPNQLGVQIDVHLLTPPQEKKKNKFPKKFKPLRSGRNINICEMAFTWREKTAHIEKYSHRPETPTHMKLFYSFSHAPPPGERLLFPLACAHHDLHSFYFVCLRELEKKICKTKQKQNFSCSHLTFFWGGEGYRYRVKYS